MKIGEEPETEDKREALTYLEEALSQKDLYIAKTLESLPEEVSKEQLIESIKGAYLRSYKLRMSVTGRKVLPPQVPAKPVTAPNYAEAQW